MGMTTSKVAVSIPSDVLAALERVRKRLGTSRSALVTQAIEHWLRSQALTAKDEAYVEGYLRVPEDSDNASSVALAAVASWERWE